jgi:hypothetical protein
MNTKEKTSLWRRLLFRLPILGGAITVCLFLAASPSVPVQGQGDNSCKTVYPAKSSWQKAFFDLIDGGTCWSCPNGTVRSLASVKAKNACVGFTKATLRGKYGCKRKYSGSFFDPRKGGECWKCPSGYKRTLTAVTHAKACAKDLVFGPWKKAAYKGKSGCDKGFKDPIDGGTCWTCPSNSKRTVFSVKSNKACEVQKRALNRGKFLGFKTLTPSSKGKIKKASQNFSDSNSGVMVELNNLYKLLNGSLKNVFKNNALANAVENGNYNSIWTQIDEDVKPILKKIRRLQKEQYESIKDFTVLSISASAEGSAFIGGSVEQGILLYFDNPDYVKVRGFTEYGATISTAVGIGVGVSVGIWRASETDCGAGFGVTVSVGVGKIAEVGGTIGINPQFPCSGDWADVITARAIDGIAISVSAGVGVPLSPVNVTASFSSGVIWDGKLNAYCDPCGGLDEEACGLTERFPSCDAGLVERCGVCKK